MNHFYGNLGPLQVAGRNLCGLEPQLIKLEFIIYLPKLKVSRACRPVILSFGIINCKIPRISGPAGPFLGAQGPTSLDLHLELLILSVMGPSAGGRGPFSLCKMF